MPFSLAGKPSEASTLWRRSANLAISATIVAFSLITFGISSASPLPLSKACSCSNAATRREVTCFSSVRLCEGNCEVMLVMSLSRGLVACIDQIFHSIKQAAGNFFRIDLESAVGNGGFDFCDFFGVESTAGAGSLGAQRLVLRRQLDIGGIGACGIRLGTSRC